MKLHPFLLGLLAAIPPAWADIHVVFANRLIAAGINAPVTTIIPFTNTTAPIGPGLARGPWFMAQLYAWVPGHDSHFKPVGRPVPFRTGLLEGSITPHVVAIPAPGVGGAAVVQMVAWCRIFGETYEEVLRQGLGGHGLSWPINIHDAGPPAVPADMTGLQPFSIAGPLVPAFPLPPSAPASLHTASLGNGRVGHRFTGLRSGWELTIETSTNLIHWQPWQHPWLPRGQTEFTFEVTADGPAQFFRGWQH